MSRLFSKKANVPREGRILKANLLPERIVRGAMGDPPSLEFAGGKTAPATCVGCDAPCLSLDAEEVRPKAFADFPIDIRANVCPTDALRPDESGFPRLEADRCIGCGVCASRCPAGAIFAVADGTFAISNADGAVWERPNPWSAEKVRETVARLSRARREARLVTQPEPFVALVQERIDQAFQRGFLDEGGLLVRNLMTEAGIPWANRRRGDTSFRIDSVFQVGDLFGVAEAEYTYEGLISAPRCLLDDCAVASARLGRPLERLVPIVVCLRLPNGRSEFYEVISDISKVLGVRIRTITVGLLLLIHLAGRKVTQQVLDAAYLDRDNKSLVPAARQALGRDVDAASMPVGALAPEK